MLENGAGTITMIPQDGELCSVNGSVVTGPCQQTQGKCFFKDDTDELGAVYKMYLS